jgi:hypothetical protein
MLRRLNLFRLFLPCCLLGMMLLGLGGKLWLIYNHGTALPDVLQWQAGLPELIPHWADGEVVLGRAQAVAPVEFPLLARLALGAQVHANRQWDERLTTLVNALLLVCTMSLLLAVAARRLGWLALWSTALCAGVLLALPLGWEQSLAGSALPDRLGLLLAFPAAWALLDRKLESPLWLLGAVAMLLATAASELTAAVCIATGLVALIRAFTTPARRNRDLSVVALTALCTALVFQFQPLQPFGWSWAQAGALLTPFATFSNPLPWVVLVLQAPIAIRMVSAMRNGDRKHSVAPLIALTAACVFILVALAWCPSPRHWGTAGAAQDIAAILLVFNFCVLTQFWHRRWLGWTSRALLTSAWVTILAVGLREHLETTIGRDLPARTVQNQAHLQALRDALRTGQACTTGPAGLAATSATILGNPRLQAVLPAPLQPPVPVLRGPATTDDFTTGAVANIDLPAPGVAAWMGGPAATAEGGTLFISLPLPPARSGVLRFLVAGDLGTARFPFVLRSTRTGELTPLVLDTRTGERWRTVNLVRPEDPLVIIAGPASLGTWGAFTSPVEMGLWSWYAVKLAKNWLWFLSSGCLVFACALLLPLAPRHPRRDTFTLDRDGRVRLAAERE